MIFITHTSTQLICILGWSVYIFAVYKTYHLLSTFLPYIIRFTKKKEFTSPLKREIYFNGTIATFSDSFGLSPGNNKNQTSLGLRGPCCLGIWKRQTLSSHIYVLIEPLRTIQVHIGRGLKKHRPPESRK